MCLIHSYTREQALADGELVDVTEVARKACFLYPVALTASVWGQYVEVPDEVSCQDEAGRLWDILSMLHFHIRLGLLENNESRFSLEVRNSEEKSELVTLKAVCGPGDQGEPVITIMLPDED